jgi:hypothetical protein
MFFIPIILLRNIKRLDLRSCLTNKIIFIRYEVLATVDMKIFVFWGIKPCGPVEVSRLLEEYIVSVFRLVK